MTRMTCSDRDKLNSATNQIYFSRRHYFILIKKNFFEDLRNGELEILTVGAKLICLNVMGIRMRAGGLDAGVLDGF